MTRNAFPQLPWGHIKNPSYIKTEHGNLLLTSGWWGILRKPHYTAGKCVGMRIRGIGRLILNMYHRLVSGLVMGFDHWLWLVLPILLCMLLYRCPYPSCLSWYGTLCQKVWQGLGSLLRTRPLHLYSLCLLIFIILLAHYCCPINSRSITFFFYQRGAYPLRVPPPCLVIIHPGCQ